MSDICHLNGTVSSNLLLDEIGKHRSICWYPSAGSDMRPLLYLSKPFYDKHEELAGETAALPDLFIMTDYKMQRFEDYSHFDISIENSFDKINLQTLGRGDVLYRDRKTTFTVKKATYFSVDDIGANRQLITEDIPPFYGQGCLMTVQVDSHENANKKLGKWEVDVIYLYAENTAFAKNILLRNGISVDNIVKIRYGGGFGGSNGTSGGWIRALADALKVKYYITSCRDDHAKYGDETALEYIRDGRDISFKKPKVAKLYQRNWYYDEPAAWYKVIR